MESYHRKPMKKLYRITKNRSNMKTQEKNLLKSDLLQRPGKKKTTLEFTKSLRVVISKKYETESKKS